MNSHPVILHLFFDRPIIYTTIEYIDQSNSSQYVVGFNTSIFDRIILDRSVLKYEPKRYPYTVWRERPSWIRFQNHLILIRLGDIVHGNTVQAGASYQNGLMIIILSHTDLFQNTAVLQINPSIRTVYLIT